ncbi:MAG: PEP-CTERM sorting domain-containing protein [Phenylobacterium sp.]|nr:MAG: PEP-CTERM sorting domain-containing protein [Phenylobacterium sp.]
MTISVNNCQPFNLGGDIVLMGTEFGGASAGTLRLDASSVTSAGSYDIDLNFELLTAAANFFDLDDYNGLTIPVGGGNFFGGEIEILNVASDRETLATLGGEQVTFESVANPIPEPATWALLITGFGLTGAALRRRRSAARRPVGLALGFA